jgi:hypothetical protein
MIRSVRSLKGDGDVRYQFAQQALLARADEVIE